MERSTPLMNGEIYHLYNRGAGKSLIFRDERDCLRFQLLLHLANSKRPVRLEDIVRHYKSQGRSLRNVFREHSIDQRLVEIYAYSLMRNHFHLVVRQVVEDGITQFMKKLCTAYSMYFNTRYERTGVLFQGRFKSSHVNTDPYFRWIFAYVHLNPVDLCEENWKEKKISDPAKVRKFLRSYQYSSFLDYIGDERLERRIVAYDTAPKFLRTQNDLEELLREFKRGKVLHNEHMGENLKDRP